jgi:uncharacterized membrane protein
MARTIAALALLWPLVAAAALVGEASGRHGPLTLAVYGLGSRICHQRPERSFHTAGVQWPVCARCSGLYVGAAVGAPFALSRFRGRRVRIALLVAALPTAGAVVAELAFRVSVTNVVRAAAGVPLGAAIAAAIVSVSQARRTNQVN